jgi:amino acid transporter
VTATQTHVETGPRLRRELSLAHQFALSIATVGPFIVIFGFYGPIASGVGTGIFWLLALVGVLHIANANVFAHMSSLFPRAGGGYSIVRATVNPLGGFVYLVIQVVYWAAVTATVVTLAASFLNSQFSGLAERPTELVLVAAIFAIALTHVIEAGRVSLVFLILEGAFALIWVVIALLNAHSLGNMFALPPRELGGTGQLGGHISLNAFIATIPVAIFALSGYEWGSSYTEEAKDFRSVRRALVMAACAAVLVCAIAMPLLFVADVHYQRVLTALVPGAQVLKDVAPALAPILLVYVAFSSWNAGLSNFLQAARLIFDAARQGEFGAAIGRPLSYVNKGGAPVAAAIIWLIPTVAFVLSSKLQQLFIFSAVMLLFAYIAMSLTACFFYVRVGRAAGLRSGAFRWFPLVPVIVFAFSVLGIVKQSWHDVRTGLLIVLGAVLVGLIRHRSIALNSSTTITANSREAGSESLGEPATNPGGDPARDELGSPPVSPVT